MNRYTYKGLVEKFPELFVDCFECDGTGKYVFVGRLVDCEICRASGKTLDKDAVLRMLLKMPTSQSGLTPLAPDAEPQAYRVVDSFGCECPTCQAIRRIQRG